MADMLIKMKTGTLTKMLQQQNGQPAVSLDKGSVYFAVDTATHKGKIIYDAPLDPNGVDRIVMSTDAETAEKDSAGNVITSTYATKAELNNFIAEDSLVYMGVVNSGSNVPTIYKTGWVYKVGTAGTYLNKSCVVGDLLLCINTNDIAANANNDDWVVIGKVSSITAGGGLTGGTITSSGTIAHAAKNSALTSNTLGEVGRKYIQTLTIDNYGHISGYTTGEETVTNTHYQAKLITANSDSAKTQTTSALTNGNVYLNLVENNTVRSHQKISGTSLIGVTTDSSGNIKIDHTAPTGAQDTTYGGGARTYINSITSDAYGHITGILTAQETVVNTDTKVNVSLNTTTKAYLLGTSTAPTSSAQAVEAISDTGVYLDTTAGKLTATSFAGSGASLTSLNASNISSGTLAKERMETSPVTPGVYQGITVDAYGRVTGALTQNYATKTELNNLIAAADALVYKGTLDGANTSPGAYTPAADCGHVYKVSTGGYINGQKVEAGDMFICTADSTVAATSSNYSTVQATWSIVQTNADGIVIGPGSATNGNIPLFDGTTGKLIKNSSYKPSSFATSGHTHDISLASGGTSTVDLAANTAYTLTAGGKSVVFKTPADTTYGANRGISLSSGNFGHSNSAITAQGTQALYPIKIDAYGHITGYGTAVTSLPASDVYAWAKAATKPTYTASEVGAATSDHTHTIDLEQTGTSTIDLAANTVYTLTAGGQSVTFKTPADANTNTLVRTYKAYETNVELPLIGGSTGSTSPAAPTGETSYANLYGQIPKTTANRATYNLSTGKITVPGGVVANITGNASTATKFASNQSITLTGDTTGTASSQAGWNIATTTSRLSGLGRKTTATSMALNPSVDTGFKMSWHIVDSTSRTNDATNSPSFDGAIINLPWDWGAYNGQIAISNTLNNNTRMQIRSASSTDNGENANPRYTPVYGAWREIVTATKATQMGSATKPIYISNTGQVVEGTALKSAAYTESSAYATSGHTHTTSLASDNGTSTVTLTSGGKFKLTAGGTSVIFTMPTSNNYSHPTGDGNLHVPATGTTNNGKFLKAGSTAGSISWASLSSSDITTALGFTPYNATNPSGYTTNTGTVTKVTAGTGLTTTSGSSTDGGNFTTSGTLYLTKTAVTAGSYGPSANASPAHAAGFSVPYFTVDAYGRITAASTKTITLPSDNNTDTKVTQTATTTNANYEILFSETADNTTRTEAARKTSGLKFNPSTNGLQLSSAVTLQYNSTTKSLDFIFA